MVFNVGDLITGLPECGEYIVTDCESTCEVLKSGNDEYYSTPNGTGDLLVKVVKHKTRRSAIGRKYRVKSRYFQLVTSCQRYQTSFALNVFD